MASRFLAPIVRRLSPLSRVARKVWRRYRRLALWLQWAIGIVLVIALFALGIFLSHLGGTTEVSSTTPTVTVAPLSTLTGAGSGAEVLGNIRSESEAQILAQSGGTVTAIHTRLGATVPAGFVIADLDNASQRAAVLQAEGAYDAAVAAQQGASPKDVASSALNTYTSSYNSLDSTLKTYVDQFYGNPGAFGPQFLISPQPFDFDYFPRKRQALKVAMDAWNSHLAAASSQNAGQQLDEADTDARQAAALITDIATAATKYNSDANAAQLTALATARTNIAAIQANITAAKQAYQSQGSSATAGVAANVKSALGALRAAQANLEKTLVRAPIAGQVNFLSLHIGDYVQPLAHVATVAQNGALEAVAYISEENRALIAVGSKVTVEGKVPGVVTSIAPALDPVTKQIEVHVAVAPDADLTNGEAVHLSLPSPTAATASSTATASNTAPLLLPLTALKLTSTSRVVFSVDENHALVAHPVEIGDVHGDRIEVTTPLPSDLVIVTDARGLAEGEKVTIATSTP